MVLTDELPLADRVRRYLVIAKFMEEKDILVWVPPLDEVLEVKVRFWDRALHLPAGALDLDRFETGVFAGLSNDQVRRHLELEKSLGTLVPYPFGDDPLDCPEGSCFAPNKRSMR